MGGRKKTATDSHQGFLGIVTMCAWSLFKLQRQNVNSIWGKETNPKKYNSKENTGWRIKCLALNRVQVGG